MKVLHSSLLVLATMLALPANAAPVGARLARVEIDPASVKVVESRLVLDGYHQLTLEFVITPKNDCEAAFAGLVNLPAGLGDPQLFALYDQGATACDFRAPGVPTTVRNEVFLNVRPNHSMTLNGVEYRFTGTDANVQVAR